MIEMNPLGMTRVKHIHFVGIGGAGMSGIAEVVHNIGFTVSGSDLIESPTTKRLQSIGVVVMKNHAAQHVCNADVVVASSAIDKRNSELKAARKLRIPIVRRAEMLAELMRFSIGIAVAGTHGKTTTTSLIASLFGQGGLDPTYVIGGLLNSTGSHAKLGAGKYFIAEADESDASFLHLSPMISVITGIDQDHLEYYKGDYQCLRENFLEFIHRLPFYGLAIVCLDDDTRGFISKISRPVITYGMDINEVDYSAKLTRQEATSTWFEVYKKKSKWLDVELDLPGIHNIQNALAAIVIADEIGISAEVIVSGLARFQGISRRCQFRGELIINGKSCLLLDDYAHHPKEIEQTITAIQAGWPSRRLVVIYQPHRYTRLKYLFEDFCRVLTKLDMLMILDVYPAGEKEIAGVNSQRLCQAIRLRGQNDPIHIGTHEEAFELLPNVLRQGDLLMTLGAGNISMLSWQLHERFSKEARSEYTVT